MDYYTNNTPPSDSWEYGTGRTQPPKSRGGLVALLLILVIFLTGIVTVLGILNIRLFRRLNAQESTMDAAISFAPTEQPQQPAAEVLPTVCAEDSFRIDLEGSPEGQENIPQEGGLPLQEIYSRNIPSVASISCALLGSSSTGTGVILSEEGYIVTNAHVVEEAMNILVRLSDNREFPARVVGSDRVSDLAVLHIDAEELTPAVFGDSDRVQVGDSVVAIGDPLGYELRGTMTDGIISAINRNVELEGRVMNLLQTNAALNSGNSGGPLINCYGQIIGINICKISDYTHLAGVEGLGFAIPSATVKTIVDQLIRQGYVSGRPTLGLEGEELSGFYQHYYRLPAGLYLTAVAPESEAARAGVARGDIVIAIDDQPVHDMDSLNRILYTYQVGDTVTLTLYRRGMQGTVELTVAEAKG